MAFPQITEAARHKVRNYTADQCVFAISDCHETLQEGQYPYESDYAQKLWAEIDACRERFDTIKKMAASPNSTSPPVRVLSARG